MHSHLPRSNDTIVVGHDNLSRYRFWRVCKSRRPFLPDSFFAFLYCRHLQLLCCWIDNWMMYCRPDAALSPQGIKEYMSRDGLSQNDGKIGYFLEWRMIRRVGQCSYGGWCGGRDESGGNYCRGVGNVQFVDIVDVDSTIIDWCSYHVTLIFKLVGHGYVYIYISCSYWQSVWEWSIASHTRRMVTK